MPCSTRVVVMPVTMDRGRLRSSPICDRETGWLRKIYRSTRSWLESCFAVSHDFMRMNAQSFLSRHIQRKPGVFGGYLQHAVNVQIRLILELVFPDVLHDGQPLLLCLGLPAVRLGGKCF